MNNRPKLKPLWTPPHMLSYTTCCVESDADSIITMVDQARVVSLRTFRQNCDIAEWEQAMGYSRPGLSLKDDYHVSYHRSIFQGRKCYFAVHSAIEYVFAS